jgi:outer membrane protein assembly factor BamB
MIAQRPHLTAIFTALLVAVSGLVGSSRALAGTTSPAWAVREDAPLAWRGSPSVLATPDGRSAIIVEAVRGRNGDVLRVRALAAGSGTQRWSGVFASRHRLYHDSGWATMGADGRIYAVARFRRLTGGTGVIATAIEPNGSQSWKRSLVDAVYSEAGSLALSPDGADLYVGLNVGHPQHVILLALDAADGTQRWRGRYNGPDGRPDLLRTASGVLVATASTVVAAVCGRCDHRRTDEGWATVVAFDAVTGAASWDVVMGRRGWPAAYAEQRLAVAPDATAVVAAGWARSHPTAIALDVGTGATTWRHVFPGEGSLQAVAIDPASETGFLVGDVSGDRFVVAIDIGSGNLRWRDRANWPLYPWVQDVSMAPDGHSLFVGVQICGGTTPPEFAGLPCLADFGLLRYAAATGRRALVGRYGPQDLHLWPTDIAVTSDGRRIFETGIWNATGDMPNRAATVMLRPT